MTTTWCPNHPHHSRYEPHRATTSASAVTRDRAVDPSAHDRPYRSVRGTARSSVPLVEHGFHFLTLRVTRRVKNGPARLWD